MGKDNTSKKIRDKKGAAPGLPAKVKKVVQNAGAGLQNAGKVVVEKGKAIRQNQIESVQQRRDALYLASKHIGEEQLNQFRELQPDASPYATWKLLEKSYIQGASLAQDEEAASTLLQEFVLTAIELYGGKNVPLEPRRSCIALIETNLRNHKVKKNVGRALKASLTLADIALTFFPQVKNLKLLKNAKFLKKAIPWISRTLPFITGAISKVDSRNPGVQLAKNTIENVRTKLGPVPKSWSKYTSKKKG
jgi:hypothetical protein